MGIYTVGAGSLGERNEIPECTSIFATSDRGIKLGTYCRD